MCDSLIDRFAEEFYSACVPDVRPANDEEARQWMDDPILYFQACARLAKPMPERLRPLMNRAIQQWDKIESKVLSRTKQDRASLLQMFERLRAGSYAPALVTGLAQRVARRARREEIRRTRATPKSLLPEDAEWRASVIRQCSPYYGAVWCVKYVDCFALYLPVADPPNASTHLAQGKCMLAIFTLASLGHYVSDNPNSRDNPLNDDIAFNLEARWDFLIARSDASISSIQEGERRP